MPGTNPASKRHKPDGGPMGGPHDGYHSGYGRMPPQGAYQHPQYGAPGSLGHMGPQSGYMPWQHGPGQYGGHPPHPPPHSWGPGSVSAPPPNAMYGQRNSAHSAPAMTPERPGYGGPPPSYRGHGPPPPGPMSGTPASNSRIAKMGTPGSRHASGSKTPDPSVSAAPPPGSGHDGPPPPNGGPGGGAGGGGYQWNQSHGGGQQWPQHQWGNAPQAQSQPHGVYGSSPPPPPPTSMGQPAYGQPYGSNSPARVSQNRPRSSPNMMAGYNNGPMPGGGVICPPVSDAPDTETYTGRSTGQGYEEDGNASETGRETGSTKDKGRGSYKCGRCGVPKKGHVCPYQPKVSRRPGEPLPEMRSAAVQVEMDEFMTLRRLNIKIQGLPESYATEAGMDDSDINCIGEPHPQMITLESGDGTRKQVVQHLRGHEGDHQPHQQSMRQHNDSGRQPPMQQHQSHMDPTDPAKGPPPTSVDTGVGPGPELEFNDLAPTGSGTELNLQEPETTTTGVGPDSDLGDSALSLPEHKVAGV